MKVENRNGKGNPYHSNKDGKFISKEDMSSSSTKETDRLDKEEVDFSDDDDFDFELYIDDDNNEDDEGFFTKEDKKQFKSYKLKIDSFIDKINSTKNLKKIQESRLSKYDGIIEKKIQPDEIKKLKDHCTNLINNGTACIAFPFKVFDEIIDSGVFLNQIELEKIYNKPNRGMGAIGISSRRVSLSSSLFGSSPDHKGTTLEKYGFLSSGLSEILNNHAFHHYGRKERYASSEFTCFLFNKEKLSDYGVVTTSMIGDSLDNKNTPIFNHEDFDVRTLVEADKYYESFSRKTYQDIMDCNSLEALSLLFSVKGNVNYIEAHFHGMDGRVPVESAYAVFSNSKYIFEGEKGKLNLKKLQEKGLFGIVKEKPNDQTYKYSYDPKTNEVIKEIYND